MAPSSRSRTPKKAPARRSFQAKAASSAGSKVRRSASNAGSKPRSSADWASYAERRIDRALRAARAIPGLKKRGPAGPSPWQVSVRLVGAPEMTRLNKLYRDKCYATDILSFTNPEIFFKSGILGELVVCLPTARAQAREQGHSVEDELEVLLVHGLLHLLGFDHELGPKQAREMESWESKLGRKAGLIARSRSGI